MPMSGVEVPEEVKDILISMSQKAKTKDYLSAMIELVTNDDGKTYDWVVRSTKLKWPEIMKHHQISCEEFQPHYEEFYNEVKVQTVPVFALFDLSGCLGIKNLKTIGVQWCPDECNVKKKMMFASSMSALLKSAENIKVIKTNDAEDIVFDEVKNLKN